MKAQYGILRFKKYKGPAISPIEAHNERTKEQYASNPDIDTNRSRYNLHLVQPQGRYRKDGHRKSWRVPMERKLLLLLKSSYLRRRTGR